MNYVQRLHARLRRDGIKDFPIRKLRGAHDRFDPIVTCRQRHPRYECLCWLDPGHKGIHEGVFYYSAHTGKPIIKLHWGVRDDV